MSHTCRHIPEAAQIRSVSSTTALVVPVQVRRKRVHRVVAANGLVGHASAISCQARSKARLDPRRGSLIAFVRCFAPAVTGYVTRAIPAMWTDQ